MAGDAHEFIPLEVAPPITPSPWVEVIRLYLVKYELMDSEDRVVIRDAIRLAAHTAVFSQAAANRPAM